MMSQVFLTKSVVEYTEDVTKFDSLAFPTSVHFISNSYRNSKLGFWCPSKKIIDKLLSSLKDETLYDLDGDRQGLLFAAGNTSFAGVRTRRESECDELDFELKTKSLQTTQMMAGQMAQNLGIFGHISTDTSACASSMKALMDAFHLLKFHDFERVAILAIEEQLSLALLDFFGAMEICLSQKLLNDGVKPSAFDEINYGFLLGQGGAGVWLETEASLKKTGHQPIARLLAAVTAGENFQNSIGQDINGSGYKRAILWALKLAQLSSKDIDLIKTHGTGTFLNNKAEASALKDIFGANFLATAYKPSIGHTFGASGLLESVLVILDARRNLVRGILNRTVSDSIFLSHDYLYKPRRILALSAGMGNVYGAAIWEVIYD